MLTTLDQYIPAPTAPAAPLDFADSQAFATWLNTLSAATFGTTATDLATWPWQEWPQGDSGLAVWCATPQDPTHVAGLVGYFLNGPLALCGEWDPEAPLPGGQVHLFGWDLTKSRRDDVGDVLGDLPAHLEDGSPVRKTNQAGPGTQGTRKWTGLGRVLVAYR
jgi:hypothetical protein